MKGEHARTLSDLLDRQRAALGRGDLAAVGALIPFLESVSKEAGSLPGDRVELQILKTRIAEVQRLTSAALSGLRAARQRLEALRSGGCTLSTYDRDGRVSVVTQPGAGIERRG